MSQSDEKKDYEKMKGRVMEEVRRMFKPEVPEPDRRDHGIPSAEPGQRAQDRRAHAHRADETLPGADEHHAAHPGFCEKRDRRQGLR